MAFQIQIKKLIVLSKQAQSVAVKRLLKKRSIRLNVPAGNPMGNVMLNATLGQFAINSMEFQRKFLEMSSNIDTDVPLQIEVELLRNRSLVINLKNSVVSFLVYEGFIFSIILNR